MNDIARLTENQAKLYQELIKIRQDIDRLVREFGATFVEEEPDTEIVNFNPRTKEIERG